MLIWPELANGWQTDCQKVLANYVLAKGYLKLILLIKLDYGSRILVRLNLANDVQSMPRPEKSRMY